MRTVITCWYFLTFFSPIFRRRRIQVTVHHLFFRVFLAKSNAWFNPIQMIRLNSATIPVSFYFLFFLSLEYWSIHVYCLLTAHSLAATLKTGLRMLAAPNKYLCVDGSHVEKYSGFGLLKYPPFTSSRINALRPIKHAYLNTATSSRTLFDVENDSKNMMWRG